MERLDPFMGVYTDYIGRRDMKDQMHKNMESDMEAEIIKGCEFRVDIKVAA